MKNFFYEAIEACANSNDTVLIQSNERGIEIVNINDINRSPFAPEPMLIKNYHLPLEGTVYSKIDTNPHQKKFRKKNNRKRKSKRK